ncbi:hypothetical protein [Bifidobacterium sp. AGR2158]|uniref:hypothetical protein n=1 Tax=Bifidobacterium sp. AGR2158 TaxID=1280675 RepID=UPI000407F60E|nr:hypothetical protein [Bifidobacterium sp. AGR2158]
MALRLVDVMARDLGVTRKPGDDAQGHAFAVRATFTALRFWMQACCIDDGYGGAMGITQKSVEGKASDWIVQLNAMYPWLEDVFTSAMLHQYCSALVGVGDLVRTDEGTLRCTRPHNLSVPYGTPHQVYKDGTAVTAQLGLRDLSMQDWRACVLSGAIVFAGVPEHDGVVRFEAEAIDPGLPYRDDLLFLATWPGG